jgi:RNA polymerase I-specific transcription initiation factor RRN7
LDTKEASDSDQPPNSSDDEKAEIDVGPNNDLADLLNDLSDDSSGEDEVGEEDPKKVQEKGRSIANEEKPKGNQVASKYTQPSSTLAVLVTACWMIRLPVIYMDFIRYFLSSERSFLQHS